MPKAKTTLPNRTSVNKRSKFKMAGRKSSKSGLDMTNEELLAIVTDNSAGRKRPKAAMILAQRGVSVVEPE